MNRTPDVLKYNNLSQLFQPSIFASKLLIAEAEPLRSSSSSFKSTAVGFYFGKGWKEENRGGKAHTTVGDT